MTAPAAPGQCWRLVRASDSARSDGLSRTAGLLRPSDERRVAPLASTLAVLERIVEGPRCPAGSEHARAAARRLQGHLERLRLPARLLCSAIDASGRVVAGALAMPGPGRTAQVLSSRPADAVEQAATADVIAAVVEGLRPIEASVSQALLDAEIDDPATDRHAAAYRAAGFQSLAALDYLARRMPRRGEVGAPHLPQGVTLQPWRRGDPVLSRVLESTYVDTLDCPGLCGLRRTDDILEGHLAGARYVPELWSILHLEGAPVGAILLSVSHGGDEIDLVYLGLAPTARGRGLGRLLLEHGLHQVAGRRQSRVVLAVDRANAPAARLYERAGFVCTCSRLAMIRPCATARE